MRQRSPGTISRAEFLPDASSLPQPRRPRPERRRDDHARRISTGPDGGDDVQAEHDEHQLEVSRPATAGLPRPEAVTTEHPDHRDSEREVLRTGSFKAPPHQAGNTWATRAQARHGRTCPTLEGERHGGDGRADWASAGPGGPGRGGGDPRPGGRGVALVCDHRDRAAVAAVTARNTADGGWLDLLVNNAQAGYERLSAGGGRSGTPCCGSSRWSCSTRCSAAGCAHATTSASRPSQQPHRQHLPFRGNASF